MSFIQITEIEYKVKPDMTAHITENDHEGGPLPENLRPFFWDVDFHMLSVEGSWYFIISRLMEHGDEAAMKFLFKTFGRKQMIHVLKNSRSLSTRSRRFWRIILQQENEPCTPKRYPTPFGAYLEY